MQFRAEFFPKPFSKKIRHNDALMLVGSCFTEQVGNKLAHHKFRILQNPNGILFNPISIYHAVESYIHNIPATKEDLFYSNELWGSWQHHTRFSSPDADVTLARINDERSRAHQFLQKSEWLMLTLGSAFVYELTDAENADYGNVVANCHKVPTDKFNRRLLKTEEIVLQFSRLLALLKEKYPHLKVIFTISPVRHLREGFIENNRSKAALISAVHELLKEGEVMYFPAYELVLDDLRDYRFYAEDLVHPNYAATNYVWEKFITACIDEEAQAIMKELSGILSAVSHKPFNPDSTQHAAFKKMFLEKALRMAEKYEHIDLRGEIEFLAE